VRSSLKRPEGPSGSVAVILTVSSLAIYGDAAFGPPRPKTAFAFIVVPRVLAADCNHGLSRRVDFTQGGRRTNDG